MGKRYGLEIRAAKAVDAAGIADLMAAAGLAIPAQALTERLEALEPSRGAVLLALEWGPPTGLVVVHWYQSLEVAGLTAEVTTLLVGPEDRRKGVGRLLLKAAARSARLAGCKTLRLQAGLGHPELQAFCAANGFITESTCFVRPLHKRSGETAE